MEVDFNPSYKIGPAIDFTQSHFSGGRTIPGSTVKIPKDQKKLLDNKESWRHETCRQQQGFFNVPPEVCQSLKRFLSRKLMPPGATGRSGSLQRQANVPEEDCNRDSQDGNDKEETQTRLSWSQSPEHHRFRPDDVEAEAGKNDFLTQPPLRSSPPHPSVPAWQEKATLEATVDDQLRSSQAPEDEELELEVPSPLGVNLTPVNKIAQLRSQPLSSTPPSAQIVPCTYEPQEFSSTKRDVVKQTPARSQYGEVPELYHSSRSATTTSLGLGLTRTGPGKPALVDVQSSTTSATNISSSSIIPATHNSALRSMDRLSPEDSLTSRKSAPSSSESHHSQHIEVHTNTFGTSNSPGPQQSIPSNIGGPRPAQQALPLRGDLIAAPASAPHHQPMQQPETPLANFVLNYPNYSGSKQDFVTACTYLQTLVGQRRLRSFLFDDFIRAWCEGYLPYVQECDKPGSSTKALTALKWFNQIDEPPMYTKQIITKSILETIPDFYPEEAAYARGVLSLPYTGTLEKTSKERGTREETLPTVIGAQSGPSRTNQDSRPGISTLDSAFDRNPPETEPPKSNIPTTSLAAHHVPGTRALSLHTPTDTSEKRPQGSGNAGLTRSLSEIGPHKRKLSDTFQAPPPKRLSTSFASRPTSSSGGSVHSDMSKATVGSTAASSVAGGRRRFADDPEKRREQLMKHMRKYRKQNPASSLAPASTTPTSGQKQPDAGDGKMF